MLTYEVVLLLSPLYGWQNWGKERLWNLYKVTWLLSDRNRPKSSSSTVVWVQSPCLSYYILCIVNVWKNVGQIVSSYLWGIKLGWEIESEKLPI